MGNLSKDQPDGEERRSGIRLVKYCETGELVVQPVGKKRVKKKDRESV